MAGYDKLLRKPTDLEHDFEKLSELCAPYTLTSVERMHSIYNAVRYIVSAGIPGDVVECGVFRGGSAMMAAHSLMHQNCTDRRIFLYDTFEGMAQPTEKDVYVTGQSAMHFWEKARSAPDLAWCYCPMEEVQGNMASTGYPDDKLVFVKGKVEDTIPGKMPESICLLRLDTDFFDSTYHELCHLFPLLSRGGVLIIDDYGSWQGAKEATDQYFTEHDTHILLNRIDDYGARLGIKL
jgi:hypothetical protein